ncbi:alpha/beta fold hydrolase [Microbacterium sp. No. 7]|uniref:alpha/beta fold hydrolase n=1 Tax=Microbacterium sp. No. 7 TaxID=1714373 RepID=UPI0006CF8D63|nr:alpha/beta fold hydrolase [Microbacterium sp. No. 7]ALJ19714.1 hypothetical protein AOA12_07270 [Microbacterium sp. No. 7]
MTSPRPATVVFLHGIGVGPESWDAQVRALPDGFAGVAPRIAGLRDHDGVPFTLDGAVSALCDELDRRGLERVHVCGLSLGALVATRLAATRPERVASLVLSGGQVRPHPVLMRVQNGILRLLPARIAGAPGMSKGRMLDVLRALAALDLRPELSRIGARTLVLCGARDRANIPAARELAASIPHASLQIVPGAGHEWNTQLPHEFSSRLNAFLASA